VFDRGLTFIGIALTIAVWALSYIWPKLPKRWAYVGAGAGATIFVVGLGMLFLRDGEAQPPVLPPSVNGDCNVFGNNNSPTCNKFITPESKPKVETLSHTMKMDGDQFVYSYIIRLDYPGVVPVLLIKVIGDDIQNLNFEPIDSLSMSDYGMWKGQGFWYAKASNLRGRYNITVTRKVGSEPQIQYGF
jgi:hypothetical protein